MRRFEIYTNETKDPGHRFEQEVCRFLEQHGAECVTQKTGGFSPECLLVLGGDGTVLWASERAREAGVPIFGINLGTLGYLAEVDKSGWQEALCQLIEGSYTIESRMMLEGGRMPGRERYCALNDIVIARSGVFRLLGYDVYVNGKFLNTYHADGIIICTPTGSTAYNLSAGGPIVEPGAELMVLTPICPHQINIRSIVLSARDQVEVVIRSDNRGNGVAAEAACDGDACAELAAGDRFVVRRSSRTTSLVKLGNRSFLETLHQKMR